MIYAKFLGKVHEGMSAPFKRDYAGLINLSSNQVEHPLIAEAFIEFVSQFDANRISQYQYLDSARVHISEKLTINPNQLLFTPGSDAAIYLLLESIGKFADKLLLQTPNYQPYEDYATFNHIPMIKVNFLGQSEEQFLHAFIKEINTEKNLLVIITNPNNYLGTKLTKAALNKIIKACQNNEHLLVIDQAYCGFEHYDILDLPNSLENVIIIKTLSKSLGCAGLRSGFVISDENIIEYLKKTGIEKSISVMALEFVDYLLSDKKRIATVVNTIKLSKHRFITKLQNFNKDISISPSYTNFITLDFHHETIVAKVNQALEKHKIIVKVLKNSQQQQTLLRMTINNDKIMDTVYNIIAEVICEGLLTDARLITN